MDNQHFFDQLALEDGHFDHPSRIHGRGHTYRVMVHVYRLAGSLDLAELLRPALAAVYIHDMARRHDGYCDRHGAWSVASKLPRFRRFFLENGIRERDLPSVAAAVENHCREEDLDPADSAYRLSALLKDADALDRIRLGEGNLETGYLRLNPSMDMVGFARKLYFSSRNLNFHNFTGILKHADSIDPK